MKAQAILLLSLAALALAGCSDAPPSGTLVPAEPGLAVEGTTTNSYQAAEMPVEGQPDLCVPEEVPVPQAHCTPAESRFVLHFMSLPAPEAAGYAVFLVSGDGASLQLGPLTAGAGGMFEANFTVPNEDLSSDADSVEVRHGAFALAQASGLEGPQDFELAATAAPPTVEGSYEGRTLTLLVSGLPEGSTYKGRLYAADETGALAPATFFDVANGETVYEADQDIAGYAEFHIHVGTSAINLYKATIG